MCKHVKVEFYGECIGLLIDYVSRKEGGRRLASIEDSVDASNERLEDYIEKRGKRLIKATRNNTHNTMNNRTITRKQKLKEKKFYGGFELLTSNISHKKTWTCLGKRNLNGETEYLLIAAQNNAIRTNHIILRIDKT